MNYLEFTKSDLKAELKLLEKYKMQLEFLPHHNMVCREIRGKKFYYLINKDTHTESFIPKANYNLVEQIKRYHFLKKAISIVEKNINVQKRLLNSYSPYDYVTINDSLPKVYRLDLEKPALTNTEVPLPMMHRTSFGLQVRSKSEALIAEMLYANNIDFKYELPLWLNERGSNTLIHPDFTIITKGGPVYWEHMGMMTNRDYRDKALKKIDLYVSNGITIPDGLIITMDTQDGLVDMMHINLIIQNIYAT